MLEVNFTHTVWRPKGGAQHSKYSFLQERCACGTQPSEEFFNLCVAFNSPLFFYSSLCHFPGVRAWPAQAAGSRHPWQW